MSAKEMNGHSRPSRNNVQRDKFVLKISSLDRLVFIAALIMPRVHARVAGARRVQRGKRTAGRVGACAAQRIAAEGMGNIRRLRIESMTSWALIPWMLSVT